MAPAETHHFSTRANTNQDMLSTRPEDSVLFLFIRFHLSQNWTGRTMGKNETISSSPGS